MTCPPQNEASVDGVKADPAKVEEVHHWVTLTTCVKVWRFMGLANYFLQYIKHFSVLAAQLSSLTGPWAKLCRGDSKQHSFETLKQDLCLSPVLSIWQPGSKALLTTDALKVATLAVLEQLVNREWHPVAFESRKLAALEQHYTPVCLELLAVVLAFKVLHLWLLDGKFDLRTD